MLAQAVAAAKEAWGQRQLSELDAEERLATACEKAPTSDNATSKLRAAFRVLLPPVILRLEASHKPSQQEPSTTVRKRCHADSLTALPDHVRGFLLAGSTALEV